MPKWLSVALKVVLGAVLGALVGGAMGFGVALLSHTGSNISSLPPEQQGREMFGAGFVYLLLMGLGACLGSVIGIILSLVLPRRKNQTPQ